MIKSGIVLQALPLSGKFEVIELTNRTAPAIGTDLTEKQVNALITDGRGNVTVKIKPKKK